MSIAPYIKVIGRGKEGARSLNAEQAEDLMGRVLAGQVSDLELGAFCLAMRIKGETPAELAGFLAATQVHCLAPRAATRSVWLPSYNGARKLPNLTPLLALLLARKGVPVLLHGRQEEPGRVSSHQVCEALGVPVAADAAAVEAAWRQGRLALVHTESLCPPLASLLDVRRVVGLRNPGHTVAKLLHPLPAGAPGPGDFRVVSYTHPEYADVLARFLAASAADAMLLRGTEGEPVADARRMPRLDVFVAGGREEALGIAQRDGVLTQLPSLPGECDAAGTAAYISRVLAGELAVPEPIARQVGCILRALRQPLCSAPRSHAKTA